jgi:hypothetical protein
MNQEETKRCKEQTENIGSNNRTKWEGKEQHLEATEMTHT